MSIDEAITLALELVVEGPVANPTAERYSNLWVAFNRYCRQTGASEVHELTAEFVAAWVRTRTRLGTHPSAATQNLRRTSLRHLFAVLRSVGVAQGDPTLDLQLPARGALVVRGLTDPEIALARSASLRTTIETQQPAILALAEAGAGSAEIPRVRRCDLELPARVWLSGHTKTDPRWALLSQWGSAQLARRLRSVEIDNSESVTYTGAGPIASAQASTSAALRGILDRAGLSNTPSIGVKSFRVSYGLRIYKETGRVEDAAAALGMQSLDQAAEVLGIAWRGQQ